jgi:putative photosynthetic complex assembly protein
MSVTAANRPFPKAAVWGAAGIALLSVFAAAAGRFTGLGVVQPSHSPTAVSRELSFVDRAAGGVEVKDARSGETLEIIQPGEGGFVRGVMRSFARERRLAGAGPETPVKLIRAENGRLWIVDEVTGRRVELDAFGPQNISAFSRYLASEKNKEGKS